jgi:hypothetical protein
VQGAAGHPARQISKGAERLRFTATPLDRLIEALGATRGGVITGGSQRG